MNHGRGRVKPLRGLYAPGGKPFPLQSAQHRSLDTPTDGITTGTAAAFPDAAIALEYALRLAGGPNPLEAVSHWIGWALLPTTGDEAGKRAHPATSLPCAGPLWPAQPRLFLTC